MIRRLLIALACVAASACAPRQAADCTLSFDREIAFTAPDATEIVTARSLGTSCEKTVGLYTITSADGHPLWSWTAPMSQAFGETFVGAEQEAMRAFLERWSQPRIERTSAAPAWPLPENADTTLDRLTYEDIRARDLPMLCHLSGTGVEVCVFWEPAAAGAGHFLDRDVPAEPTEGNGP